MVTLARVAYSGDEPIFAGDPGLLDEMFTQASLDRIDADIAYCEVFKSGEENMAAECEAHSALGRANDEYDRRLRQAREIREYRNSTPESSG